ncbi:MAG: GIY-YIG nuclease family protein [Gammaproteobacteria bacterium]|nr:GIY-YIG nuclease family protein [Gammaproteobacteria bacterium]
MSDSVAPIYSLLFDEENRHAVQVEPNWANKTFDNTAGFYAFFHNNEVVYIGESGDLAERIGNQINNSVSTLRTNIVKVEDFHRLYNKEDVDNLLCDFMVSSATCNTSCGRRKELEKYWIEQTQPIYNEEHNPEFNK